MKKSFLIFQRVAIWMMVLSAFICTLAKAQSAGEPNIELAKLWWPDQRDVWTPVGWPDHYFRFNVLYNGMIVSEPYSNLSSRLHARKWKGQDFLLNFTPWPDTNAPGVPSQPSMLWKIDGGHGLQGWRTNCETPVLWTDFPLQEGLVMREEVFGHIKGAGDVTNGLDPLYAWIRLSVTHVDPIRAVKKFPMIVQMSRNYLVLDGHFSFENGVTIDIDTNRVAYPQSLAAEPFDVDGKVGQFITEPDEKVRLAVLPTETNKVTFFQRSKGVYGLKIDMLAKIGDSVDLLLPMFPQPREEIKDELTCGYNDALSQSDHYWAHNPGPGALFHVPEQYINDAITQGVKFAPLITEKDYITGEYSFLSGSWGYDQLWPTPTSMNSHMFLDLLGYGNMVAKYSDVFREFQGTIKPPGASYGVSPGYFASPEYLTSINWLADHGAVLLQVSTHALLSGDPKFIADWTEPIVKACDFIKNACAQTNHDGVLGLLPPAVATDEGIPTQAIQNLAWNYKGLMAAVQFLKRIHHPRAAEFESFAENYKSTFVKAYRNASQKSPVWKDDFGKEYPKPPTTLSLTPPPFHVYADAFYLDGGPMLLVWAGLLDADDPLMQATVKFFREGPDWKLKGARFNPICRPVLDHEMSSCEPCYSWNDVISWRLGDRAHFLEGMYSLFAGSLSQQTYIACEHRDGMQGNLFSLPLAFWMARQSVIDDEITPNELHLLRLCPLAWLSSRDEAVFEKMPTIFGNVNLRCSLSDDGKTLKIHFVGDWHDRPQKVVLHVPPVLGLQRVNVNGVSYSAVHSITLKKF